MKAKEEYQKELDTVMVQLRQLEQQKMQLTTRGVELQGILKELEPEVKE